MVQLEKQTCQSVHRRLGIQMRSTGRLIFEYISCIVKEPKVIACTTMKGFSLFWPYYPTID
jgi:hypothetical protein